jgi:hypothetical protein
MEKLSSDLLHLIFQELDGMTLCRLSQVSKDFRVVADDDGAWNVAHGFTKRRSLEIVCGHIRNLLDAEAEIEEVTYFPYTELNTADWDEIEEERELCKDNANQAAVALAIVYRALRVPIRLREALAANLVEWFRLTDYLRPSWPVWRSDFVKPPGWDLALNARREAEREILEWEKSIGYDVSSQPYSIAYSYGVGHCCLYSAWSKQWIRRLDK